MMMMPTNIIWSSIIIPKDYQCANSKDWKMGSGKKWVSNWKRKKKYKFKEEDRMQERVEVWGRYKEQMNEIIKICESFRKRDRQRVLMKRKL